MARCASAITQLNEIIHTIKKIAIINNRRKKPKQSALIDGDRARYVHDLI